MSNSGFSFLELMLAIAVATIVVTAGVLGFSQVSERLRYDAAVRGVMSDLREARSKAIATGWEYRIVGYDAQETWARRNHYRLFGRRVPAAWPVEEAAVIQSDSQLATEWIDVASEFPGATLDYSSPRFELTFDARGASPGAAATFNPLILIGPDGLQTSLTVSTVGGISAE